jgi:hypothetical protein
MFPFMQQQSPMLKQGVEVSSKGESVILRIGNVDLAMHYEHAFDVSRWIREEAAICKRATGRSKMVRTLGIMTDANAKLKPLSLPSSGVAIHVKDKQRSWKRSDVVAQGRLVLIKIGNTTISLHFESALKISQWIRLRAKEARNRAGDIRHWSEIA